MLSAHSSSLVCCSAWSVWQLSVWQWRYLRGDPGRPNVSVYRPVLRWSMQYERWAQVHALIHRRQQSSHSDLHWSIALGSDIASLYCCSRRSLQGISVSQWWYMCRESERIQVSMYAAVLWRSVRYERCGRVQALTTHSATYTRRLTQIFWYKSCIVISYNCLSTHKTWFAKSTCRCTSSSAMSVI